MEKNTSSSTNPTSQDDDSNPKTDSDPKSAPPPTTPLAVDYSEQGEEVSAAFQFAPELFTQPLLQESDTPSSQTGLTGTTSSTQHSPGGSHPHHTADSDVAESSTGEWNPCEARLGAPWESINVGDEVFILDGRGNSMVSTDAIEPAQLQVTAPHNDLAGLRRVRTPGHNRNSASVYMMVGTLEISGVGLAYHFVPTGAAGEARAVWRREAIVKVRFRDGERVRYTEGGREWEALVESAEVVDHKRCYNVLVPGLGCGRILVTDEFLRGV
ncbi:hypothetical protein RBB50_008878 [Rhinocladiella similis]